MGQSAVVAGNTQADFDAAYQAEATRLIDEEGVTVDYAAASAFVFAWNNYMTAEVTLGTPRMRSTTSCRIRSTTPPPTTAGRIQHDAVP